MGVPFAEVTEPYMSCLVIRLFIGSLLIVTTMAYQKIIIVIGESFDCHSLVAIDLKNDDFKNQVI